MISILIPVLSRPQSAQPVASSVLAGSRTDIQLVFLCTPGDNEEIAACRETGAHVIVCPFERAPGDFARKINHGFKETDSEWLFLGADDLRFHDNWDTEALRVANGASVIGTLDLGNPEVMRGKKFATHSLIRRSYVEEEGASLDGPGVIYSESYDHNFVDRELCDLAKTRGKFVMSSKSIVEHLHPHWGKSQMDPIYDLGLSKYLIDQRRYWKRSRAWNKKLSYAEQRELRLAEEQGVV